MNNILSEYYKVHREAAKAIEEASNVKIPPYDPQLGMSREQFDAMVSDVMISSRKASDEYNATLKKYEIDQ